MRRASVLVAEDHEVVAQGLVAMLAGVYDVVGSVADGNQVVPAVELHRPDILLLDLSLPNRGGINLLPDILTASSETRVVVLSMHVDPHLVDAAMQSGAMAFVPKNAGIEELQIGITEALAGRRYISPKLPQHPEPTDADPIGWTRLTARQQAIVRGIARGLTSDEIADELGVTVWTVNFHRRSIRRILGIHSEIEMHRYALLASTQQHEGNV